MGNKWESEESLRITYTTHYGAKMSIKLDSENIRNAYPRDLWDCNLSELKDKMSDMIHQ